MHRETHDAAAQLIDCLRKQADQFRTFLDLLARQREALVSRDAAALERVVAEQERAIGGARRLEQHRQALTARLQELCKVSEEPLTLSRISELVAASDASRLNEMQTLLGSLQKEIERRRQLNANLIDQSIRCTSEALQWVARRSRPQPVYAPHHQAPPAGAGQIAVNRRC